MDFSEYVDLFIDESKEHLQILSQSLLDLEKNPNNVPVLNEVFRIAHTVKGTAGTMGYLKMSRLTHVMENVLHAVRNNELRIESGIVDILFKCLDALENYLNNIISGGNEGDNEYQEVRDALDDLLKEKKPADGQPGGREGDEAAPGPTECAGNGEAMDDAWDDKVRNAVLSAEEQGIINKAYELHKNVFHVVIRLTATCVMKSARAFIVFQALEQDGEIIKSLPSGEEIEDEGFDREFAAVVVTSKGVEYFQDEVGSINEVENVTINILQPKLADPAAPGGGDGDGGAGAEGAGVAAPPAGQAKDGAGQEGQKPKVSKTVRVDIERLDILMNLVSELIIQKTRLEGIEMNNTTDYHETLESLERITTDLHDAVMKVRMVPIENVFNRFPRQIRDISRDIGKQVELIMSGEETELDRNVIDEIGDPLIHMLRNSIDHGLEPTERRAEVGKDPVGRIYLRAYQEGNNVVIEVEDDGQGLNIAKIKAKSVEKGVVTSEAAEGMTDREFIDLLFKPSFSTADKVTSLSGRGVGLDVVKTKIEGLGGTVEVETELGKGSKFIIRLPLTLAIIQALLVYVGGEKYAIPISTISTITKLMPGDIKLVQNMEVMVQRDVVIPMIRLRGRLDVAESEGYAGPRDGVLVQVRKSDRVYGYVVDRLIGQQEIVVKPLGKMLSNIRFIAGATILGDGNVALILDVNSLE
ncbi:MAG: chemotaxis protein CheA [Oscillospiraceae bacterium]|nr:chemotaxis protein CheA [Oscillospiraceae bacterium]